MPIGPSDSEITGFSLKQLEQLSKIIEDKVTSAVKRIQFSPLTVEPVKKRTGLTVYADGVNWDPGDGAGLYSWNGSTWVFLESTGGGVSPSLILDIAFAGAETSITQSADMRTVTAIGTSAGSIPSSYAVSGGGRLVYMEFEIVNVPTGSGDRVGVGVETRNSVYNTTRSGAYPGSSIASWGYWNSGKYYNGGGAVGSPSTFASGDIVQVWINAASGKIWFGKNDVVQGGGDPVAGTSPAFTVANRLIHPLHAVVGPYVAGASIRIRTASEHTYSPRAGYEAAFT